MSQFFVTIKAKAYAVLLLIVFVMLFVYYNEENILTNRVIFTSNTCIACKSETYTMIINFTDIWYPSVTSLGPTLKSIPARINLSNYHAYDQIIPRNIYQTWISNNFSGPLMKNAVHSWIHLNPDYNYYFFNDDDCKEWIAKYCGQRYINAYLSINPAYGAARSDYFRYLIMWKMGGVYVDIDSALINPLRDWILPSDEFVTGSGHDVPNQFMLIAKPNHIIYRRAVLYLTNKLEKQEPLPKGGVIVLSGPSLLRSVYQKVLNEGQTGNETSVEDREPFSVRKIPQMGVHATLGGNVIFKYKWKAMNNEMSRVKTRYNDINKTKVPFYVTHSQ